MIMNVNRTVAMCLATFFLLSVVLGAPSNVAAAKPDPSPPVTYTAPITLYWLSKAKVPEAVEYVKYIDAETILQAENIAQYERVEKINKIYQEIRYASLNDFIETGRYTNVVDLGCGVSPRCLYAAARGINYVGTDLTDVVNVLEVYAPNFISADNRKYVKFRVADAADRKEMLAASKGLDGKICIVEEGLLMYLSRDRQKAMLENIRDMLKKNGGCFVTSDFVAGEVFMSINRTLYGDETARIIGRETQKLYEGISEIIFNDTMFKSQEEAVKFIESAGLKVEMRPLFQSAPDIRSIRDLNDSDIARINEMMQEKLLWVMTVAD